MSLKKLLVANRGEVAARILRTATELGVETVAVAARGDDDHLRFADTSHQWDEAGPSPYLDQARLLDIARRSGCDSVHPGYGFLSERTDFVQACERAGLIFVGPSASAMSRLGDKLAARELAQVEGVATLEGSGPLTEATEARDFARRLGGPVILKSTAGGGGRGLRVAHDPDAALSAFEACRVEVRVAGAEIYAEPFLSGARHVEVQVLGDGQRARSLGTRDCTLQRRRQKVVELAPAPGLGALAADLEQWSVKLAEAAGYRGLGTFEFLVRGEQAYFMECNPRLQVEHTVTEMVTGLDLVALQLRVAGGASLKDLPTAKTRGWSLQARVNAETQGPGEPFSPQRVA